MSKDDKAAALLSPLRSRKQPPALARLPREPSFGLSWWDVAIGLAGVKDFS